MRFAARCLISALPTAAMVAITPAVADAPKVLNVTVEPAGEDRGELFYRFAVTIRHADEGWRHYVNAYEVLDAASGRCLGQRILYHPHEDEQPFTRPLRIPVPRGITRVVVRAHDTVHGYGQDTVEVALPGAKPSKKPIDASAFGERCQQSITHTSG